MEVRFSTAKARGPSLHSGFFLLLSLSLSLPGVISHNFLFQSLTRDISYSMENLAFDSLFSRKWIELPILTTSLIHLFLNGQENLYYEIGSERVRERKWVCLHTKLLDKTGGIASIYVEIINGQILTAF